MKKLFVILFAAALLLVAGTTVFAEEADVVISGANVTALPGETVEVPIIIEKNDGFCGLNLQFSYSDALSFVSLTNSVNSLTCTNITTTVWDGAENYTGTGNLAILKFTVPATAKPGTRYSVQMRFIEAYDWDLNAVSVAVTAGSVTVGGPTASVYENGIEKAQYSIFESAVQACGESGYVKLLQDSEVTLNLTKDLYIDLNGCDLSGVITTNGYAVYGMDSTTEEYTCANVGSFSCTDEGSKAIVPVRQFKSDITGRILRYMTIEAETGYTFHRYYLGITKVSVRTGDTGFGYKAVFYGDEMVLANIDSFGFKLNLEGNNTVITKSLAGANLERGREYSLSLKNFDIVTYGEVDVNAKAFLNLKDGETVTSSSVSYSMMTMLQKVCQSLTMFTTGQRQALKAMCQPYADIMKNWGTDGILKDE